MDWLDDALVLSARRHGESAAVVTLLTRAHGAHAGLVRGGWGRRRRSLVEPGNRVQAHWRARLAEHLGNYTLELDHAFAAAVLESPLRLAAMSSALALTQGALAEREPHPGLFDALVALMGALDGEETDENASGLGWQSAYVKWEVGLLAELGFGLDLETCAATGSREDLIYVSPKSARAVSREAGHPYREKLLVLPGFLKVPGGLAEDGAAIMAGLKITGYFLDRHVFAAHDRKLPEARSRFVARFTRRLERDGRGGAGSEAAPTHY